LPKFQFSPSVFDMFCYFDQSLNIWPTLTRWLCNEKLPRGILFLSLYLSPSLPLSLIGVFYLGLLSEWCFSLRFACCSSIVVLSRFRIFIYCLRFLQVHLEPRYVARVSCYGSPMNFVLAIKILVRERTSYDCGLWWCMIMDLSLPWLNDYWTTWCWLHILMLLVGGPVWRREEMMKWRDVVEQFSEWRIMTLVSSWLDKLKSTGSLHLAASGWPEFVSDKRGENRCIRGCRTKFVWAIWEGECINKS